MVECRRCGEELEEGEEALICYEWIVKYDYIGEGERKMEIPDTYDAVYFGTTYYYHEDCFYKRNEEGEEGRY